MHHTAVHIPCLLFHTLPTLNRTFILRVSALSLLCDLYFIPGLACVAKTQPYAMLLA
jgi:hypothetical protein